MHQMNRGPNGPQQPLASRRIFCDFSRVPTAMLIAASILAVAAADAHAQGPKIKLEEVRIILETNAKDCDTGLQIFFDGDSWSQVEVEDPNDNAILHVEALGGLNGFGLTEQFNETNEPVMEELVNGLVGNDCDDPEFSLLGPGGLFELFPEGKYEFEGSTVDGDELVGSATLSHVIPAPPEIFAPIDGEELDPNLPVVIEWIKVEEPILPGFGQGPQDKIDIVGFHVVVEREFPVPLAVFTADLPEDATEVTVPPEFLEAGAEYKFEVLQIEASGNQTIWESTFETE